jgi:hypothetical protein
MPKTRNAARIVLEHSMTASPAFLSLPGELRNTIYDMVLANEQGEASLHEDGQIFAHSNGQDPNMSKTLADPFAHYF